MSALRLVEREFGTKSWFSLVRVVEDTVIVGGLRTPEEADAWAAEQGHTIVGRAAKTSPRVRVVAPPGRPRGESQAPTAIVSKAQRDVLRAAAARAANGWPLEKHEWPCCAATQDELGRLCIGDCGPDCLRRAARRQSA